MGPPSDDSDDMFNTPPKRKQEILPSSSTKRQLLAVKHLFRNGDVGLPLLTQQSSDSDSSYTREKLRTASSSTGEKSRRVDLKNSIPKKNVTSDSDDAIDSDEDSTAPRLSPTKVGLGLSIASKPKTLVSHSSDSDDSEDDVFKRPPFRPAHVQPSAVSESDSDEGQAEPASKPTVLPARPTVDSGDRQRPEAQRLSESGGHKPATRLDSLPKTTNISESSSDSDDDFIVTSPRRGAKKTARPLFPAQSPALRRLSSARRGTRTVQADRPTKNSAVVDDRRKAPVGSEIKDMPAKTSNKQSSSSESESSVDSVKQRSLSKDVPAKTSKKSSGSESVSSADNVNQRSKPKDVPTKTSSKQSSGSDSESSADNVKQRSKSKDLPAKTSNKQSSGSDSESSADNVNQRLPAKTSNRQSPATSSKYPEPRNVTKTASSSPRVATTSRNVRASSDSDSESGVDNSKGRANPTVASPDSCSSSADDDSHRRARRSSLKAASTVEPVRTNQTRRPSRHEVSSSGSEGSSTERRGEGKRAGEGLRAQAGSGLIADNTPGVLYAEDLTPDEEVWLVQCPMSLTREALLTFSFDLNGRSEVTLETGGVPTRYQATAHRRDDIAINTACLVRGRTADALKAVVVHSAGQIVVTREFSPPAAAAPSSPPGGPIPLPGGLKVRHPLFGADYERSILERDKSADPPQVRVRSSKKPERRSVTFASLGEDEFLPGRGDTRQDKKKKRATLGAASWQGEERRGEGAEVDAAGLPEDVPSKEARSAEKREGRKRKRAALVATEGGEGMGKETEGEIDQVSSGMKDEEDEAVPEDFKAVLEKFLEEERRRKEKKERRKQKTMKGEEDKPVTVDNRELAEEALTKERRKKGRKERKEQKTMNDEEPMPVTVDPLPSHEEDEAVPEDIKAMIEKFLEEERRRKEKKERRKQKTMKGEEDKPVTVDNRELAEEALTKERRKKEQKERREQKTMKGEQPMPVTVDNRITVDPLPRHKEDEAVSEDARAGMKFLEKEGRRKERKERSKQKTMKDEEPMPVTVENRELTDEALAKERRKKERKERKKRKTMEGEEDKPALMDDRAEEALAKERRKKERKERREQKPGVDAASTPPTKDADEERRRAESLRGDLLSAMLRQMGGADRKRRRDSTSADGKPAKRRKVADSGALDVHLQRKLALESATKLALESATKLALESATKLALDSAKKLTPVSATKQAHDLDAGHSAEEARKSKKKKRQDKNKGDEGGEGTGEGCSLGDDKGDSETTPTKTKKKKKKKEGRDDEGGEGTGEGCSLGDDKGDSETTPTKTKKKNKKKKEGRDDEGGLDVTVTDFAAFSGDGGVVCSTQKRAEAGGVFKAPRPPPPDDGERESGFESDCTAQLFVTQRPRKEVDGFESDATAKLFRTQRDPLDYATPLKKKKHSV